MHRKTLIISEVTMMKNGRVCIAGYDREQNCIRPVLSHPGILIEHLFQNNELIIFPTSKVQFNFTRASESPPHIEDYYFEQQSILFKGLTEEETWQTLLSQTDKGSYSNLFHSMTDRYVLPGSHGPSIGTIKARTFSFYVSDIQSQKLRAMVQDQDGETIYDIPINDIVFTQFFLYKMRRYDNNYRFTKKKVQDLMSGKEIYIRVGLARPWMPSHASERRCYLQITGVYTIPDLYNRNYKKLILRWINSLE